MSVKSQIIDILGEHVDAADMLDAVHDTAVWTTTTIKAIRELLRRATRTW